MNVLKFEPRKRPKKPCLLCHESVETTLEHKLVLCGDCIFENDWIRQLIVDASVGEYVRNLPPGAGIYRMESVFNEQPFQAFYEQNGNLVREHGSHDPEIALYDLFNETF